MAEWHPLPSLHSGGGVAAEHLDSSASKSSPTPSEWQSLNRLAEIRAKDCSRAVLPSLDHLNHHSHLGHRVYEPSDDTFLLLDALQCEFDTSGERAVDSEWVRNCSTDGMVVVMLEVGCGTGVPSVFVQQQWEKRRFQQVRNGTTAQRTQPCTLVSFATDVNPHALLATQQTAAINHPSGCLELIRCDLASALLPRLSGQVDLLLFNPPYVPTPDEEVVNSTTDNDNNDDDDDRWIAAAWAGGTHGRRVVDRFAPQLAALLRHPKGVAYVVTVDDNRPYELAKQWREQYQFIVTPLLRRRARNEYLTVQKVIWAVDDNDNEAIGAKPPPPIHTPPNPDV